ncbi:CCA tRNA nucleotidyltransferase [Sphingorhabdus arenilitoris]|uniref:CCA tRNA nucleotidyltransferase n=1 Tax=Sphingorhabdus arenilitoris TaxID=1490041 RepID=A0ABV8RGG4_9SPHN
MTQMPDAEWLHSPGLARVIAALKSNDGPPRLVGGAVRDNLLGFSVTDIDLATPLVPQDVMGRLEADRIKAIPTGIDHGTVTAVADGHSFEITTLRRDVSTDGRRATVAFSTDWQEDAARRDFTLNALYADPVTREIFDYFGGLEDLKNRHLRFIGSAAQRIAEDHLRILRYFRFLARFGGGQVNDEALAACSAAAAKMMALSRERIASELIKIMDLPDPVQSVTLMAEHGIFMPFLPEYDRMAPNRLQRLIQREVHVGQRTSATTRLLCLLPIDAQVADKAAMRLKLSNRMRKEIAARMKGSEITASTIRAFAYRTDLLSARDAAILFAPDEELPAALRQLADWQIPVFPVKGGDIIAKGLIAGPVVARTMEEIRAAWIEHAFPDGDALDRLVDQRVEAALLASKKE